jgi:hypothetical protein
MSANIAGAAAAADQINGSGFLVANWASSPALSHLTASLPGWIMAAGLAWNPAGCQKHGRQVAAGCSCFGAIVSHHGLLDGTGVAGQVLLDFGRAECAVEKQLDGRRRRPGSEQGQQQLATTFLMSLILDPTCALLLNMEGISADHLSAVIQSVR